MNQPKYVLYLMFLVGIIGSMYVIDVVFYSGTSHQAVPVKYEKHKEDAPKKAAKVPASEAKKPAEVKTSEVEKAEPIAEEPKAESPAPQKVSPQTNGNLLTDYFETLLIDNEGRKTRNDLVVRYYRHQPDGNKIDELKKYGFYIHERPVEGDTEGYESNSIYYGDSVSTEDIQLIAYVMLKKGLPLKVIQQSLYHDSWKSKSVEIGTDVDVTDQQKLSLSEIKNFRN